MIRMMISSRLIWNFGLFVIIIGSSIGCQKEPPAETNTTNGDETILRELKVKVRHRYDTIQIKDSLMQGASVTLYRYKQHLENDYNEVRICQTDTSGQAVFEHLDEDSYWIKVSALQTYTVSRKIETPAGTVTYSSIVLK